jgi:hypothetical protein
MSTFVEINQESLKTEKVQKISPHILAGTIAILIWSTSFVSTKIAVVLRDDLPTWQKLNVTVLKEGYRAKEVFKALLEKGFFTGYSEIYNYIHLYAPLTIGREEIDGLCHALELILQSCPGFTTSLFPWSF